MRRNVFNTGVASRRSIVTLVHKSIQRLVRPEIAWENIAGLAVNPEERRLRTTGLKWHKRKPRRQLDFLAQKAGQLLDCGRLKQRVQRQFFTKDVLDLTHHADRQQRVSAKIKKAVSYADRLYGKNCLPNIGQLAFHIISGNSYGLA